MTTRVQLDDDGGKEEKELEAPEGAEGDNKRVTISDDGSDGGDDNQDGDRPDWLPEKFDSEEDLAKAYTELEKKLSSGDSGDDDDDDEDEGTSLQIEEGTTAEEAVEEAGLDVEALNKELIENDGTLTDETFEAFEEKGISREMVEGYIEGQKALQEKATAQVLESVGGAENFEAMTEWAKTGLSDEDIQAFNNSMNSGDVATMKLAAAGLRSAYEAAEGRAPNLTRDGGPGPRQTGAKPFASNEEMSDAMADPRYRTDPAYRREVKNRIAAGM